MESVGVSPAADADRGDVVFVNLNEPGPIVFSLDGVRYRVDVRPALAVDVNPAIAADQANRNPLQLATALQFKARAADAALRVRIDMNRAAARAKRVKADRFKALMSDKDAKVTAVEKTVECDEAYLLALAEVDNIEERLADAILACGLIESVIAPLEARQDVFVSLRADDRVNKRSVY